MILSFNDYLNESINDKLKLKVLFLCGSPNSGKSTIIKKLSYIPFQNIDMDNYIKLFADKEGLDLDLRPDTSNFKQKNDIRIKSRDLAVDRMVNAINSMFAIVIDGTGRDVNMIFSNKKIFEEWGYDTAMLLMDIDLETALLRNTQRDRKVPEHVIVKAHDNILKNVDVYKKEFKNFWFYNSLQDTDESKFKIVEKGIRNFFYSPVQNIKGQEILSYLTKNKLKYISDYNDNASDIDFYS